MNVRAKEMQKASEVTPSGMMTVFCFWGTKLKLAIQAAKEYCKTKHHIEDPICVVANYLFPEAKVLAGHEEVNLAWTCTILVLFSKCILT